MVIEEQPSRIRERAPSKVPGRTSGALVDHPESGTPVTVNPVRSEREDVPKRPPND